MTTQTNRPCRAANKATCRVHSTKQVETARNAMLAASYKVAGATTLDELQSAKTALLNATTSYDATSEGQESLKSLMASADPIENAGLAKRLALAEKYAEELEDNQKQKTAKPGRKFDTPVQPDADGLVSLVFPTVNTYDVPTSQVMGRDYFAPTVGSKFNGRRDVSDIIKNVRVDLKEAQKKGYLPQGITFSATTDKYSRGQAILVEVRNLKEKDVYKLDEHGNAGYTADALELNRRVTSITAAYNTSVGTGEDYQTMYYSRVTIENDHSRKYRAKEAVQAKAKRDDKPIRENFRASYMAQPDLALNGVTFTHEKEGSSVGRIGKSNLFVHKSTINGKTKVRAYDLNDMEFSGGIVPEDYVLENAGRSAQLDRQDFLNVRSGANSRSKV